MVSPPKQFAEVIANSFGDKLLSRASACLIFHAVDKSSEEFSELELETFKNHNRDELKKLSWILSNRGFRCSPYEGLGRVRGDELLQPALLVNGDSPGCEKLLSLSKSAKER